MRRKGMWGYDFIWVEEVYAPVKMLEMKEEIVQVVVCRRTSEHGDPPWRPCVPAIRKKSLEAIDADQLKALTSSTLSESLFSTCSRMSETMADEDFSLQKSRAGVSINVSSSGAGSSRSERA